MRKIFKQSELDKIDIKGSPRVRSELREEVVEEYIDNYENKVKMPDVVLFENSPDHYIIGDGMHRVEAMRGVPTGKWAWAFDVRKGTFSECLRFALQANIAHGLRRTNSDKRAGAAAALKQFPDMSDGQLAEVAAVSESTIARVREELVAYEEIPATTVRKGKDGKSYRSPKEGPDAPKKSKNANKTTESAGAVSNGAATVGLDTAPAEERCKSGAVIPQDILPLWNRRNEVNEMLDALSGIKCYVAKAVKAEDPLYAEMDNHFEVMISNVYQTLKLAVPYAVCTSCNGKNQNRCTMCKGRGMISQFLYESPAIKDSIRKMREQLAAKPRVK